MNEVGRGNEEGKSGFWLEFSQDFGEYPAEFNGARCDVI